MKHHERVRLICENIEKAMDAGCTKFYIYPFGSNGMLTKEILNNRYGIQESGIFDNKLAERNVQMQRINEIVGGDDCALLLTIEGAASYELINAIPLSFDRNHISRIFKNTELVGLENYGTRIAPWSEDDQFLYWQTKVRAYTLVDKIRLFNLWHMVKETAKLGAGDVIEVGAWRGGSGCLMAKSAALYGTSKDRVYLCDTFSGVVKAGKNDDYYVGGEHADTSQDIVVSLAKEMDLDNISILKGIFPEDTGRYVKEKRFRLAHVDVDVYKSAKDIVDFLWEQMLPMSIIVFDDYGFESCGGIRKYLDEVKKIRINYSFHQSVGRHY